MSRQLAATQALFWQIITGASSADAAQVEACFVSTAAFSASARMGIYTRMYADRLVDALATDFPNLAQITGDAFDTLMRAYVAAMPSEHPSINHLGRELAPFLRRQVGLPRADLADLAALEWARNRSFDAASVPSLEASELARLPADRLSTATLQFVPCLHTLTCRYDVDPVWRAMEDGAAAPKPRRRQCALAVWRHEFAVLHTVLDAHAAVALDKARDGASLAEICEVFAHTRQPIDAAFTAIGAWFGDGWVSGIVT